MRNILRPLNFFGLAVALLSANLAFISSAWGQASIWTNPITGADPGLSNPYTTGDVNNSNITVSGIGRGGGVTGVAANDRYNASSWNTASLDPTAYFNFTLTPNTGYHINFSSFVYTAERGHNSINMFAFRSDANGDVFTTNIGSPDFDGTSISLTGTDYQNITTATEFRYYTWNANNASRTYSINDFTFNGSILGTSTTALTGFSSCANVAGTAQSFTVNGSGLVPADATITISGTTNYEVSTTSANAGFSNTVNLTAGSSSVSGTVWVRLKANPIPGNYNGEKINVSGGGFSVENGINVSCSGTVLQLPTGGTCDLQGDYCYTNSGSVNIKASGGAAPYNVTWTPAHGPSQPQVISTDGGIIPITGLHANTNYLFTILDANGCQAP